MGALFQAYAGRVKSASAKLNRLHWLLAEKTKAEQNERWDKA